MYKTDLKAYNLMAKAWTESFAKDKTHEDKINKVTELGFDESLAVAALTKFDFD